MTGSFPVRFTGTDAERAANYATHHWVTFDHEEPPECMNCCAKTWHAAADYPCGVEPPRTDDPSLTTGMAVATTAMAARWEQDKDFLLGLGAPPA